MGNWRSGLKFGREKGARGWLIMVSEVMVMNEMNKGERIVQEEKAAPEEALKLMNI